MGSYGLYLGSSPYYDVPSLVGYYDLDGADSILHVGGNECIAGYYVPNPGYYPSANPIPSHFDQKNGTHQIDKDFSLGIGPNGYPSYGTYTLSGGSMEVGGNASLNWGWSSSDPRLNPPPPSTSTSIFTQSGQSTLTVGGNLTCLQRLNLQGGSQSIGHNLMIGQANDSSLSASTGGIYTMSGGSLNVGGDETIVGYKQPVVDNLIHDGPLLGTFTQTGGLHKVDGNLYLGKLHNDAGSQNGTQALYTMDGASTTLTVVGNEYLLGCPVPDTGLAAYANRVTSFIHTNGTHSVQGDLYVGYDPTQVDANGQYQEAGYGMGYGLYQLSQGALQVGGNLYVGQDCQTQSKYGYSVDLVPALTQQGTSTITIGGSVINVGTLSIASSEAGMTIGHDLLGGSALIQARQVQIGGKVEVQSWSQTGGQVTVAGDFTSKGDLSMANDGKLDIGGNLHINPPSGNYGRANSGQLTVGGNAFIEGSFGQGYGITTIHNDMVIGSSTAGRYGRYTQLGGTLTVGGDMYLGSTAPSQDIFYGTFNQYGGTTTITNNLYINNTYSGPSNGYCLGAGRLNTGSAFVGTWAAGELYVGSGCDFSVANELSIGPQGRLAGEGQIHLTGSSFSFEAQADPSNPALADDMKSLTFIFEGGSKAIDPLEVAGVDYGATLSGFGGNFAFGTLTLGGTDIGQVQLVDTFDNQPDWTGREALYVHTLNLGAGSTIDLHGLNLYYVDGLIDPTATINLNGGYLIQVPEAGTMSLLILGGFALARRWNH